MVILRATLVKIPKHQHHPTLHLTHYLKALMPNNRALMPKNVALKPHTMELMPHPHTTALTLALDKTMLLQKPQLIPAIKLMFLTLIDRLKASSALFLNTKLKMGKMLIHGLPKPLLSPIAHTVLNHRMPLPLPSLMAPTVLTHGLPQPLPSPIALTVLNHMMPLPLPSLMTPTVLTHGLPQPLPSPIALTVLTHGLPLLLLSPRAPRFPTDRRLPYMSTLGLELPPHHLNMSTHGLDLPPHQLNLSFPTRLSDIRLLSMHAVSSFPPLLLPLQWVSSKLLKTLCNPLQFRVHLEESPIPKFTPFRSTLPVK